ncbi:hypothetical protein [Spiroplasma endosymbiont of Polydrusus pterygomalis]|uniref:hypothetical protein n=1 Tax=Spiroplasma endosymbiont of Polydrusus pterygomalis TaxID=3139327 RepID=UPI003CCA93B9
MKNKKIKLFFLKILYWTIHGLTLGLPVLLAQFNKLLIKLKEKIKKECDQLDDEKIETIIKNNDDAK